MKKVTRSCCPVCGKNVWDRDTCPEHYSHWLGLLVQRAEEIRKRMTNEEVTG